MIRDIIDNVRDRHAFPGYDDDAGAIAPKQDCDDAQAIVCDLPNARMVICAGRPSRSKKMAASNMAGPSRNSSLQPKDPR
jgi:hypothetical protein